MNRLKLQWEKLAGRLDAMTLRERAMVFAAAVGVVLYLVYTFALNPMLQRQKLLMEQIRQQNNQISGIDMEITAKAQAFAADPDAPLRAQLQGVQTEIENSTRALMTMQKGLVAPDRITPLLEKILQGNGKLKLVSLNTLPVTGLNEAVMAGVAPPAALPAPAAAQPGAAAPTAAAALPPAPAAPKPRELLYRHGVEIVLQGSYPDMISYMDALESLPAQLFWGKARLDAGQYPNTRLTLTLYTLSLDQKWMQL